ncbi:MAG: hypothetical protein ABJR46_14995 [Tateyamaria sp.]|uniref:hypothetical protein n=1 Tax=Tateyamaria sp. TaxID=1929288 RepID=UPI00329D12CB
MPETTALVKRFTKEISSLDMTPDERAAFFRMLGVAMGQSHHLRPECVAAVFEINDFPQKAPEIYKDRVNKDENALEFIKRVYKPWLNKGLSHNQLNRIDTSAYYAYRNYTKYHAIDPTILLPDQTTQIDREYEILTSFDDPSAASEVRTEIKILRRIYHFLDSRGKSGD